MFVSIVEVPLRSTAQIGHMLCIGFLGCVIVEKAFIENWFWPDFVVFLTG